MISFVRADGRIIHGQIITRWSKGCPCGGIITVNDEAVTMPILKQSFAVSTDEKVFVWAKGHFLEKAQTVLDSNKRCFLITRNPVDMKELLVDNKFVPSDVKRVVIGPCSNRPGAAKLGQNQPIAQRETETCEAMTNTGHDISFALLEETAIGS